MIEQKNWKRTYYGVLGLIPGTPINLIRDAYKAKVMLHHPDRGGSHEKMCEINEAWEVLSNHKTAYDNWLQVKPSYENINPNYYWNKAYGEAAAQADAMRLAWSASYKDFFNESFVHVDPEESVQSHLTRQMKFDAACKDLKQSLINEFEAKYLAEKEKLRKKYNV